MNRILVIRGGAIGDFILTLPALKALRDGFPQARLEILGYKHIAQLAENRFYAEAVRSIEYGPLSDFFARGGTLDPALRDYFGSFDLIVSYLYDPDGIFGSNLRRCGIKKMATGPAKIGTQSHAVRQLLRPMVELSLKTNDLAPKIFPSPQDQEFARQFLDGLPSPIVAMHPGSGSEAKNWPVEKWISLGNNLLGSGVSLVIAGGEADEAQMRDFARWKTNPRVRLAQNISLPQLGAILEHSRFVGHDSGISHLAAAAGAKCILLFGPTDPAIWGPLNENVQILRAVSARMEDIEVETVYCAVSS